MFLLKSLGHVYDCRYLEPTILAFSVVPDQPNMNTLVYFVGRKKVVGSSEPTSFRRVPLSHFSKLWPLCIDHYDFNGSLRVLGSCL